MNAEVSRKIEGIAQDRTHGAGWLSREAIGVMKLATEKSEAQTIAQFLDELTKVAAKLIQTRPGMASITNSVSRFVYEVFQRSKDEEDLDSLRSFAGTKGDELIEDSMEAALKAAEKGALVIEEGDILMTCSYSATICETFRIAKSKEKGIEVIALESKSYGEATARELKPYGISVRVVTDNAIGEHISPVKKVFVGADSILGDGSLINGTPTYELASAAKKAGIPFYSVCESVKLDVRSHRPKLEKGFDLIPPHLITRIITEEGMIRPGEVIDRVKRFSKWVNISIVKGMGREVIVWGSSSS